MGIELIKKSINQHVNAKNPEKILPIKFENMVQKSDNEIKRTETFLDTSKTKQTAKFLLNANCPRVLDHNTKQKKLDIFKNNVDSTLYIELVELSEFYEEEFYGIT